MGKLILAIFTVGLLAFFVKSIDRPSDRAIAAGHVAGGVTAATGELRVFREYDVSDILAAQRAMPLGGIDGKPKYGPVGNTEVPGKSATPASDLYVLIRDNVDRCSWYRRGVNGVKGEMAFFGGRIVVMQSERNQDRVAQLLADVREQTVRGHVDWQPGRRLPAALVGYSSFKHGRQVPVEDGGELAARIMLSYDIAPLIARSTFPASATFDDPTARRREVAKICRFAAQNGGWNARDNVYVRNPKPLIDTLCITQTAANHRLIAAALDELATDGYEVFHSKNVREKD